METRIMALETTKLNVAVAGALKGSTVALKTMVSSVDMVDIGDTMHELDDNVHEARELGDLLAEDSTAYKFDEDELNLELERVMFGTNVQLDDVESLIVPNDPLPFPSPPNVAATSSLRPYAYVEDQSLKDFALLHL